MKLRISVFALLTLFGAGGCLVPEARYKESVAALRAEMDGHRRTLARLYEIETKLVALERTLSEREQLVASGEQRLAQAELDAEVTSKEREAASEIVDQLRNDLARVGDHLRSFAQEKAELAEALDAAEARAERLAAAEREAQSAALVMRDLSLSFHESIASGDLELIVDSGRAVVRVPRGRLIAPDGKALHPEAGKIFDPIVKVASLQPKSRLAIGERGAKDGQDQQALRLKQVADALTSRGVLPERVAIEILPAPELSEPPPAAGAPASEPKVDFAFGFED
jgi:hypothetical protein